MLTIFTIPKSFEGPIAVIQHNALQSWLRLQPSCEVILCGDDAGVDEVADEYNLIHVPDIERNEFGTPLVSSAFEAAQAKAERQIICYVNADIIFFSDLMVSVTSVHFDNFLLIGQRWDMDLAEPIDFDDPNWEGTLKQSVRCLGRQHSPTGSDYFIFRKNSLGKLPDFAVGRPGWDNWFIYNARSLGHKVIDLSPVNIVVHQNHDYAHVQRWGEGTKAQGPEERINWRLMGGQKSNFTILDSTHVLTTSGVRPALEPKYVRRRLLRFWQRYAPLRLRSIVGR